MKISTVSIVAGSYACNAKCPFCVASMTPHVDYKQNINEADMRIGCRLGQGGGATTCLITGKGEPTLYPDEVTQIIKIANEYFPLMEMQTNGTRLPQLAKDKITAMTEDPEDDYIEESYLTSWQKMGLRTICLSTTHFDHEMNKQIYGDQYLDIQDMYDILDNNELRLRISVIMYKGGIDTVEKAKQMIDYCRTLSKRGKHKVQLTMRPVVCWDNNSTIASWTKDHLIDNDELENFYDWLDRFPVVLRIPPEGKILDVDGQNLCVTDCLTTNSNTDEMRQIIIYPDGKITYDWKYEAAFLI